MANLKEIRTRILSVNSTKQITSAMKLVSAAKLRRAQDVILQMRPYSGKLREILSNLTANLDDNSTSYLTRKTEPNRILIVVITSNRGLCGAFNANVIRKSVEIASTEYSSQLKQNKVDFICIGKKAVDFFKSKKYNVISAYNHFVEKPDYEEIAALATEFMNHFKNNHYNRIELVYNQFKNAATQILTVEHFLPVEIKTDQSQKLKHDYIFEPTKEKIISDLIPRSLKIQFYKAILDSIAAEHGARMTAMHKATDNATELLRELRLNYNKARQSSITNEILEIVGGAEALRK